MLTHLMTSWHLNIWKDKIWLSHERKELQSEVKKYFSLFHKCSLTKQTIIQIKWTKPKKFSDEKNAKEGDFDRLFTFMYL